jgi:hypothetical protein
MTRRPEASFRGFTGPSFGHMLKIARLRTGCLSATVRHEQKLDNYRGNQYEPS